MAVFAKSNSEYIEMIVKSKKQINKIENPKEVAYKCIQCFYVVYKKSSELPPTFCPNCATNHRKGDMIRLE
jgi:rubrerythrin